VKKDGYIFIETILAALVVIVSLTTVISTYSLITRKNEINKYYNRPNELYSLYYIMKLGDEKDIDTFYNEDFLVNKSSCNEKLNYLVNCSAIMEELNIINIGYVSSIKETFKKTDTNFSTGMIEFLDHLQTEESDNKVIRYVVGEFEVNRERYYAALKVENWYEEKWFYARRDSS